MIVQRHPKKGSKTTKKHQQRTVIVCAAVIGIAGLAALFLVDYGVIADRIKSIGYEPSAEMQVLIDAVDITSRGDLVLKASHPILQEHNDFNNTCQSHNPDLSVLGCFAAEHIYIYDVKNEELNGIRQSTLAHELLHAVWYRMSSGNREKLAPQLQKLYEANIDELKPRLEKYPEESFYDELHSIIGTEVSVNDLSSDLKQHYAEYFNDHTKIISYHEAYSEKFQELKRQADDLYAQITANQSRINAETTNYNDGIAELNIAIEDFNRRAASGAFTSMAAFNSERSALIDRQQTLQSLYGTISTLVSTTNGLIDQYNGNITRTQALVDSINSNTKTPESIIND